MVRFNLGVLLVWFSMQVQALPIINEFVFDHTGTDTNEFIEVYGDPNTDYSAYSLIVIENDTTSAYGQITYAVTVGSTDANGYWTTGFLENLLQNGSQTLLLVSGFTGASGNDLDTDDDGTLDSTPWTAIVDEVAILEDYDGDVSHSAIALTSTYDNFGSGYEPGGASRIPNGTDTDSVNDWVRNDYEGEGFGGSFVGTPENNEAYNTPGAENQEIVIACTGGTDTIYDIQSSVDGNGDSTLVGNSVSIPGIVTAVVPSTTRFYMQDGTGAYSGIYVYNADVLPAIGDCVIVAGTVEEYYNLTEITSGTVTVDSSNYDLPAVEVLTTTNVNDEQWESVLVRVESASVDSDLGYGEFEINDGSGATATSDTIYDYSSDIALNDTLNYIQGPVEYSYSAFKVTPRDATDFEVAFASSCTGGTDTIYDIQSSVDANGDSTYNGSSVSIPGIVTAVGSNIFFMQNSTGEYSGIYVYQPDVIPAVGDCVLLSGTVQEYYNWTEIVSGVVTIQSNNNTLPAAKLLATADVNDEAWESVLVRVENATVTDDALGNGEFEVSDGSGAVVVNDLLYAYSGTNGEIFNYIQGPVEYSYSAFKIAPRDATDLDSASGAGGTTAAIYEIQGATHTSPYDGQTVTTTGIVTVVLSNGFFMQDATGDGDDDTSDGIFVYTSSTPTVGKGDEVEVTGKIDEYQPQDGNLTITEFTNSPTVTVLSSGNSVSAVVIGTAGRIPPNQVIDNDSFAVFDPDEDGIDFYESLEGMLVQVNNAQVVGPTKVFGSGGPTNEEFYVVGDNLANASQTTARGGVYVSDTDYNPEIIVINNAIQTNAAVNVGDQISLIEGVYHYNYGKYLLYNTNALSVTDNGLKQESTSLVGDADTLSVAVFNVENLDPNDADGDTDIADGKFDALASIIVNNLQSPHIVGAVEIQDNTGSTDDGVVVADLTYQTLADAIVNAGGPSYSFVEVTPADKADGGQPGANIRVGFLYNTAFVSLVDRGGACAATDAVTVTDNAGTPVLSGNPCRIDPTNVAFNEDSGLGYDASRKSIVGEFTFNGQTVFVVVNHLKSKSGDGSLYGDTQPPFLESEAQRIDQAQILNDFVDEILAIDANANIAMIGDFNDFQFSLPLVTLEGASGAGNDDGVLHNLFYKLYTPERYSYSYTGNSQSLDHILVSNSLVSRAIVDVVHVNAEFSATIHASDHDPLVATLDFPTTAAIPHDFNNDGVADLLIRNPSNGNNLIWLSLNELTQKQIDNWMYTDSDWDIVGDGDFNGDYIRDILWYSPDDDPAGGPANLIWLSADKDNILQVTNREEVTWKIKGIGDFNADGEDDIFWQQIDTVAQKARHSIWLSADSTNVQDVKNRTSPFAPNPDQYTGWLVYVGDFNGNGQADLLWRNSIDLSTHIWQGADHNQITFLSKLTAQMNIVAVGDFDGDGSDDILWQDSSDGSAFYWPAADQSSAVTISTIDLSYSIVGVADFDGNGSDDLLIRTGADSLEMWPGADSALSSGTITLNSNYKVRIGMDDN